MANPRTFISFDYDHDEFLRTALVGQSKHPDTDFEISDWSVKVPFTGNWRDKGKVCVRPTTALPGDQIYEWSWDNLKNLIRGAR